MDYISEWKLLTKTKDIKIYIYNYINNENKNLEMKELYKINKNIKGVSNIVGDLICSWYEINLDKIYTKKLDENNNFEDNYKLVEKIGYVDHNEEKYRLL